MDKIKVGIIGCGMIFPQYVKGCRGFEILDLAACADINPAASAERSAEFDVPARSVEELLADPAIQIVVNLTPPQAHAPVTLAALRAGKNVHTEKPFGVTREEGQEILATAKERGLLVGGAPDTFLGGGLQTCRKLMDEGAIGKPLAAIAFVMGHGPEGWHRNNAGFFYLRGAGPLFDVGPYYLTALVNLLGPVTAVSGMGRISAPERISPGPNQPGEHFPVETPTHVTGSVEFAAGTLATLITSYDVYSHNLPCIEIYGTAGTLSVPDPNIFGGPVKIRLGRAPEWTEVPLTHNAEVGRGIGVADMAYALCYGRPYRPNGQLAYHILDVMQSILEASETGRQVKVESSVSRPAPLPLGLRPGTLDE
jgi:predicted dehydrogenase